MKYSEIIKNSALFKNVSEPELLQLLRCLNARLREYEAGEYIFGSREVTENIGLCCSGTVHIVDEDFWGNRTIVTGACEGELFAVSFALAGTKTGFSAVAAEKSEVLLLNAPRAGAICVNACEGHKKLMSNLLSVLSADNLKLSGKIGHLSKRTTREKLLSYLMAESARVSSDSVDIPFNRQQLADYLAVDRSAMSSELSRMQRDGIISFKGNHFTLCRSGGEGGRYL